MRWRSTADVAGEGELKARRDGQPVHRADDGERAALHRSHDVQLCARVPLRAPEHGRRRLQVHPGAERPVPGPGEDRRRHVLPCPERPEVRRQLREHLLGQRGERRRAEIARGLATDPDFILLDEPFAGVDPISVNDIKGIIRHLKDRGIGVLITDHNVRETLDICDTAYIVSAGHIIASGDADTILGNQQVRDVYLGADFRL